ncbi:uncharacterized protein LOC112553937 [Pomacea canaliculata]|nr:uncharacterized protein LOC112553937 [Pomacea canaliculata]XP_025077221.1 uncharacterized protein LOC112553937 [Pomacea canaliculata]
MEGPMPGGPKGKLGRKTKKRSSKKRSSSQQLVQSAGGARHQPDRYHCTSFSLVSNLASKHQEEDDGISRMSWCSADGEKDEVESFPFVQLPVMCKLKIFSYLHNKDKGRLARVCREWASLLHDPCLWDHVSFSELPSGCLPSAIHPFADECYTCYKVRVSQFSDYLKSVKPVLRFLEFKFDFSDMKEHYLEMVKRLLARCACRDLRVAHLYWKETPREPLWLESERMTRCEEVVQRHRLRQRLFVNFFDHFTSLAPRLSTLVLPFDWSENSISSLARLKNLKNLVLEKYFVFQHLRQEALERLLVSLPHLQRLLLEVWTPSGHGLVLYSMASKSLQYLDVSQSRGFYLQSINMPNMERFRVARHPWNGPLALAEHVNIQCLHTVLAIGAPNLTKINDHYLESDWRHNPSPMLEEVLKSVCSCRRHKTAWAM